MKSIKYLSTIILLFCTGLANAQAVEMADTFRSNGKIYVVVLVASIVISFIAIYMIRLDFKVTKLEKMIKEKH